jgi:outer membrane lipoprotein-sorting protein
LGFIVSFLPQPVSGEPRYSAETLFNTMEARTEKIDSIEVDVRLSNSLCEKEVSLLIKGPNKFAINFKDGSIKTYFNGKNLWIYIASINEAFYHSSTAKKSYFSYFSWFKPAKIFTNLTRKTLFTLFKVTLVNQVKTKEINKFGKPFSEYTLKFDPKIKSVFKQVFGVGHYHMTFSSKNYLPVSVEEFSPKGHSRGKLIVKSYKINQKIDDKEFEFKAPPGTTLVPISVVLAQKLEECGKFITEKLTNAAEEMKNKFMNWSF